MKTIAKTILFSVLWFIVLYSIIAVTPSITYAGFGVSPGSIFNDRMRPGAQFDQEIVLSRSDPTEDLYAVVEPDLGEMRNWFIFEPGMKFLLPQGQQRVSMIVKVRIPEDTEIRKYAGVIRVKATPKEEKSGISVVKGARIDVDLIATEFTITQLEVKMIRAPEVQEGDPLIIYLKTENSGNVPAGPSRVTVDITDLLGNPLKSVETTDLAKIPAFSTIEIPASFAANLPIGEYYGNVKVYLGNEVIYEEKIVIQVIARIPQTTTSASLACKTALLGLMQKHLGLLVVVLLIALILIILTAWYIQRRSWPKGEKVGVFVLVTVLILVVASLIIWIFAKDDSLLVYQNCIQRASETSNSKQSTDSAEVKGTETERVPVAQGVSGTPLVVNDPEAEGKYSVYERPDVNSIVVYIAEEGEKLEVIEERALWYQVYLPDKTSGYLPKGSVKK